jgi:hypothetical protein
MGKVKEMIKSCVLRAQLLSKTTSHFDFIEVSGFEGRMTIS